MTVTKDEVINVLTAIRNATKNDVLFGIPGENAGRDDSKLNNPTIGYIMEYGSPAQNVPARPWLYPGVFAIRDMAITKLRRAMILAIGGNSQAIDATYHNIGPKAVTAIMLRISAGLPPPLSKRTLEARARRKQGTGVGIRKGATKELASRKAGNAPSVEFAKPLIDTGGLTGSITYVIRKR